MGHTDISRRSVLQAGLFSALAIGLARTQIGRADAAVSADGAAFAGLRDRWSGLLSGGAIDPSDPAYAAPLAALDKQVAGFSATLDRSAGRTALFTDLPLGSNSANVTSSFNRLKTFALGYVTPGTSSTGDPSLLGDILAGLDFLVANAYTTSLPRYGYGNWWDWQIGSSQALTDTATLVYAALSADQVASYCAAVDHFVPDPTVIVQRSGVTTSTGANRLDLCRAVIVRSTLGEDSDRLASAVAAISPTLPLVTSGDGLYADGSYIQHYNIPYTGTYGAIWLGGFSMMLAALGGSPWAVTDPNLANLFFAATDAFEPVIYNGLMLDSVRGRAISRVGEPDYADGTGAMLHIIDLSAAADPDLAQRLRSMAKGWLERTPQPLSSITSIPSIATIKGLSDDHSVIAAPEPVKHSLFPTMARAVHRRPGWAASLSMASDLIAYYETGNGENVHGWHTGSGMTQIYLDSDNTQFNDGFWPTVDPYRLPGITASQKRLADAQGGAWGNPRPRGATWVGGASDGEFATVGQDLKGPFSSLVARKSWFFVDDAVVCLGAGISATDGAEVDSVVENRNLGEDGGNALLIDGRTQPATAGWRSISRGVQWAHLDGVGGYVFPGGADLTALRERRTGSWHDINTGGPSDALSRTYVTLLVDHGTDPAGATYAYALLPGASPMDTQRRATGPDWLKVLANTADRQAVRLESLGVTAANFFAAGSAGRVAADAPAAVLIRERADGTAVVCVSDPAAHNAALTVTWRRPVRSVVSRADSVRSVQVGTSLVIRFGDLRGLAGATQQVVVTLA